MVNKKGFIRVFELLIAVALISIILIIVYKQNKPLEQSQDLSETARDVLTQASSVEVLRIEVINAQTNLNLMPNTIIFINDSLPEYLNFELRACELSSACGQSTYVGNVYSAERIISTDKNNFNPVKLRLFLWVDQ